MDVEQARPGIFRRIGAVLRLRCPRCCRGRVWRAPFRMDETCPVCGVRLEREPGYFTGAMYASYAIGIGLILPVWMAMLFSGVALVPVIAIAGGMLVFVAPISFHYSRVAWMHIDAHFNPATFET